jgi:hypothetical protein
MAINESLNGFADVSGIGNSSNFDFSHDISPVYTGKISPRGKIFPGGVL